MIEHKFFYLVKYKKMEEAEKELDRLMMYEGYMVLCCVGRKNNVLLLRRILEDPVQEIQQPQQPAAKATTKKQVARFPDAVVQ